MHRPSAPEFLAELLKTMADLPPDLAQRFEEVLKKDEEDRSHAIRKLFEDAAGE
jgi:metal-responsive CopG/Arc/MetJ family transcriptional regulator